MGRVKGTRYLFVRFQEDAFLDVWAMLNGSLRLTSDAQAYAISIFTGREYAIDATQLRVLACVPAGRWMRASDVAGAVGVDVKVVDDLARRGLLISDGQEKSVRELRRRDEELSSTGWHLYAALYHFMTRWEDVRLELPWEEYPHERTSVSAASRSALRQMVDRQGFPPHHFHTIRNSQAIVELPLAAEKPGLYEVLRRRKTTREFDDSKPLKIEDLSALLYYVFGCHGYAVMLQEQDRFIVGLKKTSPSGGDLHPTEVYVLANHVMNLDPGLYHYRPRDHTLELIRKMNRNQAKDLADEFTVGQSFSRSAQALFIMTTRFYRNFWKYRDHPRAYSVLLMDAAHLSQTFYLVCAELGLGAFLTAAVNHVNIEKSLGIDGFEEGAIAICGCGKPARRKRGLDPRFRPYVPRRSSLPE